MREVWSRQTCQLGWQLPEEPTSPCRQPLLKVLTPRRRLTNDGEWAGTRGGAKGEVSVGKAAARAAARGEAGDKEAHFRLVRECGGGTGLKGNASSSSEARAPFRMRSRELLESDPAGPGTAGGPGSGVAQADMVSGPITRSTRHGIVTDERRAKMTG